MAGAGSRHLAPPLGSQARHHPSKSACQSTRPARSLFFLLMPRARMPPLALAPAHRLLPLLHHFAPAHALARHQRPPPHRTRCKICVKGELCFGCPNYRTKQNTARGFLRVNEDLRVEKSMRGPREILATGLFPRGNLDWPINEKSQPLLCGAGRSLLDNSA